MEAPRPEAHAARSNRKAFLLLCLGATGVVFGDIGTSPLYTWNEIRRTGALDNAADIIGAASLLVWTLTLAITVKYVGLVLRADNHGEGGTFSLMGLLMGVRARGRTVLLGLLTFGACLLYAEGLITPAISVLGATEGLTLWSPRLEAWVVPLSILAITAVFAVQHVGTARIGTVFGVVMATWFLVIGCIGAWHIADTPQVLAALWPHHALAFVARHSLAEVMHVLGAVVLAITGGEALYADMGHFGARSIRRTWNSFVYPALTSSYLGQAAFLLSGAPVREGNVFYSTVSEGLLVPLIALATMAAIIASQALISGAFSLSRSAMLLGLLPRMQIHHTSETVEGQIYLPVVNWALWAGCCTLVLTFGSASALAGAYGFSVMGVIVVTTLALSFVARHKWGWSPLRVGLVFGPLFAMDLAYFLGNAAKLADGAWLPLALALALYGVMYVWRTGRARLAEAYRALPRIPIRELLARRGALAALPRSMIFLVGDTVRSVDDPVPVLLLKFVDRYGALPKHTILFTVVTHSDLPYWLAEPYEVAPVAGNIVTARMHVGFMEQPDVRAALVAMRQRGLLTIHPTRWTILVGREEIVPMVDGSWPWRFQMWLFRTLVEQSSRMHHWFGLGRETGLYKEIIPVVAKRRRMVLDVQWGFAPRVPLP